MVTLQNFAQVNIDYIRQSHKILYFPLTTSLTFLTSWFLIFYINFNFLCLMVLIIQQVFYKHIQSHCVHTMRQKTNTAIWLAHRLCGLDLTILAWAWGSCRYNLMYKYLLHRCRRSCYIFSNGLKTCLELTSFENFHICMNILSKNYIILMSNLTKYHHTLFIDEWEAFPMPCERLWLTTD